MPRAAADYPHVEAAKGYGRDVVAGRIDACKWTRLACKRFLRDLRSRRAKAFRYRLDPVAATRACQFVELMPHVKGEWARRRENVALEPWQAFILVNVFGWLSKGTGLRRFRTAYIEVPRKNAKSTLAAAIGLYMLTADDEEGAEVYSAATTRAQAQVVFKVAQSMARKSEAFRENYGVEVNAHNINVVSTGSRFEALSAEAGSLDGLNTSCSVIDELHAHKTRAVYDVLETATGSRAQPLLFLITTAGSNRAGICYEQRAYLTKALEGVVEDETYFGVIYSIDEGDDWTDPKVWAKANPNYGISVFPDDIARLCRKARQMSSAVNNFLTKRLSVWVNADSAWMDMRAWDRCADHTLCIEDFAGDKCFGALDLASKIDIAARINLFVREVNGKPHYYGFGQYYLPQAAVDDGRNSQYSGWERDGRLVVTDGEIIDFEKIEEDIIEDAARFNMGEIAYDPFQATYLVTRLMAHGVAVVEYGQTVKNMSDPMKTLEALVRDGRFHHDGCPVMTWMMSNVVCHTDAKENIYPRKERPENKIDGPIALIMTIGRALAGMGGEDSTTYLQSNELLVL